MKDEWFKKHGNDPVFDADGIKIEVGETLYRIDCGRSVIVHSLEPCTPYAVKVMHGTCLTGYMPSILTHNKPID